ncbi:hypothetical protein AAG570_004089 [Ranatra chinensis]|uniref:Uncharacterized protein n=1 Tax=Ranatra chinensis TaxID=642074 RepID=A0ABD0Y2U4_9HEMI
MEDGNLLDRVRILLQRDIAYYELHQNVLQEALCPGVVGGALDFPHHASFAAVKMVTWWEQNHISVFASPSDIRGTTAGEEDMSQTMTEEELVTTVSNTCQQLMGHLHTLTQQALDHADLQVLISTLGAAAVVANALWVYNHNREAYPKGLSFTKCVRDYQSMCEALAERLLDLHCRLISLYVLQDADSLHWEDGQQFFESERGSFVVQMWWLYMNDYIIFFFFFSGTKDDLWNTVPPKTAQRIFAGMLNESLTILSVRYSRVTNLRSSY